ncbi:HTH domain-containing protein [Halalkalirubrum salinum]|uniref:HTH domain-containing protein n=1 Tax=Halalkalirubrum salinum TaxID=2563889 RepID=UPI0010FB87DA|nr:HTH domain-containing protein [Halalkalirubrum salinum]
MATVQLSSSQKRILTALVSQYREGDSPVNGRTLGEAIDRNPGTIRNQMQTLRAIGLVEGVVGPKGGYIPTPKAYEALDIERMDEPAHVPVERDGVPINDVNVEEIDLATVYNPDMCRARVVLRGPISAFREGDHVSVGPTPSTGLRISGVVDDTDTADNLLVMEIRSMDVPGETSVPA